MSAPWEQRALRRTPFRILVRVEAEKLAGTRSDKVLLALTLPLCIGVAFLFRSAQPNVVSAYNQVLPIVIGLPLGQVLVMSSVIKLVAGEWHYRSVQPTLLQQPSRLRYLLAQLVVVTVLVGVVTAVQVGAAYLLHRQRVAELDGQDIISARPWWALGVVVTTVVVSVAVVYALSLLVPNTPTVLTLYLVSLIVLLFVRFSYVVVDQYLDPTGLALYVAGSPQLSSVLPSLLALAVLLVALSLGVRAVVRRDAS